MRVIAPDIGGGFGMKVNLYAEELAVVAASIRLGRPVKYCADRLEVVSRRTHMPAIMPSRQTWPCRPTATFSAMEIDDVGAVGAYGMPLRFNVAEGMMADHDDRRAV